jgi:hypothetical protein
MQELKSNLCGMDYSRSVAGQFWIKPHAILNYAYTVLESELRIKTVADGYDPTIGIMHEGRDGSSKFVFDLMEPERPRVDRSVLRDGGALRRTDEKWGSIVKSCCSAGLLRLAKQRLALQWP